MIHTEKVTFRYPKGDETFNFPDIDLQSQEDLLILGKSGKGKTTLLHLLAGLLQPVSGKIQIENTVLSDLSTSAMDAFRGRQIGLVFQKNYAVQSLSLFQNLKARLFFSKTSNTDESINDLLEELGLLELKDRKTNTLSVGQLQRLGIAMAVVHGPKVILADEPTSSLDDENCQVVIDLLKKQAAKNKSNLIVITHDQRVKPFFQKSIIL